MREYDYLEVTEGGRVFRMLCKEVIGDTDSRGYKRVRDGKGKRHLVHRLVASKYHYNPDKKPQVNHKDKDTSNNHKDNLEWVTAQENQENAIAKTWWFMSPDGYEVEIFNLSRFCRENGLNQGHMWAVHNGDAVSCKGWTKP